MQHVGQRKSQKTAITLLGMKLPTFIGVRQQTLA
jgi:hypothetical protein